jgi:hypothetical protein
MTMNAKAVMAAVGMLVVLLVLAACGAPQAEVRLPLAEGRPTLFFFYTDG